ncbi:hypothetical protein [Xylophilus sp. GOD-11R]|uniref:hypothetical protein n=1 Tax=Xylophilus sp. GOD-11R TaxID=3089814 RepID=UPI00298C6511|nr:hypothetical protein [Xylophilus sp. GOD-11R]WPB59298.1 hypothetical protein R9X41_11900 [Xylophilus sp. GOD-11R]
MNPNFLYRGIACIVIGAAVLLAPRFMGETGLRETIAGSYLVGWFAIVLGAGLVVTHLTRGPKRRR